MSTAMHGIANASSLVLPHVGWRATLTGSWSLAGGTAGGLMTAALLLLGRMHPDALLPTAGLFAMGGSMLGTVHGFVLGSLVRPDTFRDTTFPGLATLGAAIGGFIMALILSLWLGIALVAARAGDPAAWIILLALAPITIAAIAWGTLLGWFAIEDAYVRWPDHRIGSLLMIGAFIVMVGFIALRPTIPGTQLQLSTIGGMVLAALATLWLAAPAIFFGLRLMHRERRARR